MSDEPRTRHIGVDELTRALAGIDESVASQPIRVTRDAQPRARRPGDPATALGLGAPRRFEPEARGPRESHASELPEPRLSLPPAAEARTRVPAGTSSLPAARTHERGLRAWHAWLAGIVLAGFASGALFALGTHATRATARVPPAILRAPPALPAGTTVELAIESVEREPPVELGVGHAIAARRSAVDALLAGRTRVALEHYRRVLALATPPGDRAAIERVAQVLARELRSCEQEAGTPCGF
jgi:hypothetical protein